MGKEVIWQTQANATCVHKTYNYVELFSSVLIIVIRLSNHSCTLSTSNYSPPVITGPPSLYTRHITRTGYIHLLYPGYIQSSPRWYTDVKNNITLMIINNEDYITGAWWQSDYKQPNYDFLLYSYGFRFNVPGIQGNVPTCFPDRNLTYIGVIHAYLWSTHITYLDMQM